MLSRGRVRAPVTLLTAAALAVGMFLTGQSPASAAGTGGAPAPAAGTASATAPQPAPPNPPAQLAGALPAYTPAGCNVPDPKKDWASCDAMIRTRSRADRRMLADADGPPAGSLSPSDIQAAYRLPATGQGQTVALVDAYGDSSAESDLAVFRAEFGLPACTTDNGCFRKTDEHGGAAYPADDANWAEETSLDLDAVSAACPACHILLVQGDTPDIADLSTAAGTAVRLGAKFVSNSYGIPGEIPGAAANTSYEYPGVVVTASSGDKGNIVNWPASDPDVVAVGGTSLTRDAGTARGWSETAWNSGGSGCSAAEPRPVYQATLTTGCATRGTADIAADADPQTGLAVYDTLGNSGWFQVGGTSLASPLTAAMYALAGTPAAGTFPVTYPYADQGNHLFDVTAGSDGTCGDVRCTAGPGWDGPTGLGTPDGVTALTTGPHATATGTVTDTTGAPVAGAAVALTDSADRLVYHALADAQGHWSVPVSAGTYDVTASFYGYASATRTGVVLTAGATGTADLALAKTPTVRLSGTVTDGSGHGWPLYARITVDGYPGGALHTDPTTGRYSVDLPRGADYTLHVTPAYPGYGATQETVTIGAADVRHDVRLTADRTTCVAPGYAYPAQADFEGWRDAASHHGWTVTDRGTAGSGWAYDTDAQQGNFSGGTGDFAAADPYDNAGAAEDTDLTSPVVDMTGKSAADLRFETAYLGGDGTSAQVQLSTDSGTTWSTVWQQTDGSFGGPVDLPLPQAANRSGVVVRFRFAGSGQTIWEVDDVSLGDCGPLPGGLVEGVVTDANTHDAVPGALVTDSAHPQVTATAAQTPDDPALGDAFYWLFSPGTGRHSYTTAAPRYTTATTRSTTVAGAAVRQDVSLRAGRLAVTPGAITVTEAPGERTTREVTLTNRGTAPLRVTLDRQSGLPEPATGGATAGRDAQAAPAVTVPGTVPTGPATRAPRGTTAAATTATAPTAPAAGDWRLLAATPEPVMDNAAATYQGRIYSVGGVHQIVGGVSLADAFVHDPVTDAWSAIAPLPEPRESPAAAFVNGTLYVVGGWDGGNGDGVPRSTVFAYHPATDTWTRVADLPLAVAGASAATLDGKLYVVGGCTGDCGTVSAAVYRYDPARDHWTRLADYPVAMQWSACAGLDGDVVCAGGLTLDSGGHAVGLAGTNVFHPGSGTWTHGAPMPFSVWAGSSSGSDGRLQVTGGVAPAGGTNQSEQYDPLTDSWSALPNAAYTILRGGGSGCGFDQIGGSIDAEFSFPTGGTVAEQLPGYGQCGGDDVSWLTADRTTVTLAPGRSVRVRVTVDAARTQAAGGYTAGVVLDSDTPYTDPSVAVTLHVIPPHHGHVPPHARA